MAQPSLELSLKRSREQLLSWISEVKNNGNSNQTLEIVMGNQACDLDSIVSAITLAFFKNQKDEKKLVVGLLPIPKEQFRYRTEATFLFKKTNLNLDDLIFLNDIQPIFDFPQNVKEKIEFTLTDHNVLSSNFSDFSANVVQIVDHHVDENKKFKSIKEKRIEFVGSTCTLVGDIWIHDEKGKQIILSDSVLRCLLLSTINLDTMCFDPKMKKTFPLDIEVYQELQSIETRFLYGELMKAKLDSSSLSSSDLLLRDYKDWIDGNVRYGIASVMLSIQEWFTRSDNFHEIFSKFCSESKIEFLIILCAYQNEKEFERQMIFFQPENSKVNVSQLIEKFKDNEVLKLIGQKEEPFSLGIQKFESQNTQKWGSTNKIWFFVQKNRGNEKRKHQKKTPS